MRKRSSGRTAWIVLAMAMGPGTMAHERSLLQGPDGARGEARLESDEMRIEGEGLPGGIDLSIRIAEAGGALVEAFTASTDHDGKLRVRARAGSLPAGAASTAELAGRAIAVTAAESGETLLEGVFAGKSDVEDRGVGSSPLDPPAESAFPAASGRLRVKAREGRHLIEVKVRGLAPDTAYTAVIVPTSGDAETLGIITTQGGGNGALKIDTSDGGALPSGATGVGDLAGLLVRVVDGDGAVVLAGLVPAIGDDEGNLEFEVEVEFDLARPAGSPEGSIRGDVNLRTEEGGKDRVRVRLDRAAPDAIYSASIRRADAAEGEALGVLGTDEDGKAELERLGRDILPLGAASIAELAGAIVEVRNAGGALVLSATVPQAAAPPPPPPSVERFERVVVLSRPDPAPLADAHGKVEIEEEEDEHVIEVEVQDLRPGAAYRVELRDPAGLAEALFDGAADAAGDIRRRLDFLGTERLPFGVASFRAYDGFAIAVLDAEGRTVLAGAVDLAPTGGGGAAIEVSFLMVGDYDAPFLRGDSDRDFQVSITDAIVTMEVLFQGRPAPRCEDAMDANDDGGLDISDAIFTLFHLFSGGRPLPFPGDSIGGFDPSPDGLACRS